MPVGHLKLQAQLHYSEHGAIFLFLFNSCPEQSQVQQQSQENAQQWVGCLTADLCGDQQIQGTKEEGAGRQRMG